MASSTVPHLFRNVILVALLFGFFFLWHSIDEKIRERRHFCEVQNTTSDSEDIILNAEGLLNDTLLVSAPWKDPQDPRIPLILKKALLDDLDCRATLIREGFKRIVSGSFTITIPPMPKPVKIYPTKKMAPRVNPYPVEV